MHRHSELSLTLYGTGALITWVLIFFSAWIYCIATYGFLFGVGLGWLAAGITASALCWLWPLYVFAILVGGALFLLALTGAIR